ncbi:MAG: hypothetical protein D6765_04555 [Bacteroidetes bacterium]|nr:MAG: hypothetical protein D6765_04555 [Bacteroidota bacterium]
MDSNHRGYMWTQTLLFGAALYCLLVALAAFLIGEDNFLSDSALVGLLLVALFSAGIFYLGPGTRSREG